MVVDSMQNLLSIDEENLEYLISKCSNFERNLIINDKEVMKSIYQIYFFDQEYDNYKDKETKNLMKKKKKLINNQIKTFTQQTLIIIGFLGIWIGLFIISYMMEKSKLSQAALFKQELAFDESVLSYYQNYSMLTFFLFLEL